jgi:hypothetical protein
MREWRCGCTALHLSTSWRWVVNFTPRPFYALERVPGSHWIGGWVGLSRSGRCGVEKTLFPSAGNWTLDIEPVAIPAPHRIMKRNETSLQNSVLRWARCPGVECAAFRERSGQFGPCFQFHTVLLFENAAIDALTERRCLILKKTTQAPASYLKSKTAKTKLELHPNFAI